MRDDATITDFKAKLLVSTENGGDDNIRIWNSPTKTKEIFPDKNLPGATQWVLDELPERVWVEGLEVGNASLSLRIEGATGALFTTDKTTPEGYQASTSDTDQVKFGVFGGNLTLEGVAEKDELHPGGFVFYNDNDSDESGILDLLEDVGRTTQDPDWLKLTVDPIAPLSLGGLYSLNFSGSVRIWHDNGNGTFSYITPEDYFSATDPPDFFVEGFSTDSEDNIRLDFVSTSGKTTQGLDKVKVKTSQVVVEWAKIKDQAGSDTFNEASGRLEEEKAKNKNKGAFILLNNDDDDYDGEKDSNNTLVLSNQENDLLPVYVKKMPRDTGNGDFTYSLRKGSKLRLWTEENGVKRSFADSDLSFVENDELKSFAENDELKFYVDAKTATNTPQVVNFTVTRTPTNTVFKQLIYTNVFTIKGPLNVPDFSVYEYDVKGVVANRAGTMWVDPGFGQLREQDPAPGDNIDAARLFWNVSKKIAKARYQATSDYVWARDVNVVQIVLDTATATIDPSGGQNPKLNYTGNVFQGAVQINSRSDERALCNASATMGLFLS